LIRQKKEVRRKKIDIRQQTTDNERKRIP